MIVSLAENADADFVRRELARLGVWVASIEKSDTGKAAHVITAAHSSACDRRDIEKIMGVSSVSSAPSPHPRLDAQGPIVEIAGVRFGCGAPVVMAGPCSVESETQIRTIAKAAAQAGATFLRGGAYKPRTSPYSFEGHGAPALAWIRAAADEFDLRVVTEVISEDDVEAVTAKADLVQIGSRNMQNFALLHAVGRTKKPALLKRAMSATIEEWLLAAEHLLSHGSSAVVLCERGVKGFDPSTRNLLDLGAVAVVAHAHRLPVIVDPSHATGRRDLVAPLARAAIAAGACGVIVEAHHDPASALSDGPQAIDTRDLASLVRSLSSATRASETV